MSLCLVSLLLFLVASVTSDCPPGTTYEPYFNKCYKFFNTPAPFLSAEQTCNSIGGHLVAIQNAFENTYVSGQRISYKSPKLLDWAQFAYDKLMVMDNQRDIYLFQLGKWSADHIESVWTHERSRFNMDVSDKPLTAACNNQLPFVCAVDPNSPFQGTCSQSTCAIDAVCSSGYTFYNGNCMCYKYFKTNKSFDKARTSCIQEGGTLASIPNSDVNEFLTSLPGIDCHGITCPSIGLYCTSSSRSSCKWADGSPLGSYSNFHYNGTYHSTPPGYASPFVLVVAPPTDPEQRGAWEPQANDRTYICQKPSTRMAMLMTSSNKEGNNTSMTMKFAGRSRSDAN